MLTRIAHWIFLFILTLLGLILAAGGGFLISLGGSVYYLLTGLAVLVTAGFVFKRSPNAVRVYGLLFLATIAWAVYESDGFWLAFLPRVGFWMGLGLWFLTPWYRDSLRSDSAASTLGWVGAPTAGALAIVLFTFFQGHELHGTGTVRTVPDRAPIKDWRQYGNVDGGTRFAELDQINTETVGKLKEVWRYRTGVEDAFKMTPVQVGDLLYLCGSGNVIMAVDADSGEEVWRHDPEAQSPGSHQYAKTCRGLSYFAASKDYEGECKQRIVTGTIDARLIAVDALTGARCEGFGDAGSIHLREGLSPHKISEYYVTSPPVVADDVLVTGGLVLDSQDMGLPSGVVRAFDAITGEFAWAWDLGNPGVYTEPAEGEFYTPGTPNVWTVMSYDPELDLVYAPTGNASPDYYGGARRPFDDEWSSAIVALDAATGEPRWKYQTVHHDVWDYDLPGQPVLVDVEVNGETIPAVAVGTKMGEVFLVDRRTGEPVHDTPERPVPQDPPPGEYLSPTQPETPLPHFHPTLKERDMWGLTPVDQLACRIEFKMLRYEGLFTPPTTTGTILYPANFGGFNWGSVSVDADNGLLVAAPMRLANRLVLVTPEQVAEAGPRAALLLGNNHPAVRYDEAAPMPADWEPDPADPYDHRNIRYYALTLPFMSRLGTDVPCFEPPWSEIAVMDLNTKELLWRRPLGNMKDSGPFGMRTGLPIDVGVAIRAGTMTTRGGLTFVSSTMDHTVRAFDVRTGELRWSDDLPGSGQSTPMSYQSQRTGRQYLIVTVPNPSWRYPRDPATGTYTDSQSVRDGKGGYVIAYAIES